MQCDELKTILKMDSRDCQHGLPQSEQRLEALKENVCDLEYAKGDNEIY